MNSQTITLLIGSLGGLAAYFMKLPIPWLVGSLIIMILLHSKVKFVAPNKSLSRNMRILLGVSIGGLASKSINESIQLPATVIVICVLIFVLLVTAAGAFYFKRKLKFNNSDALISALPGGLTFLLSISDGIGDRFPKIAMMHTVRMLILVSTFSIFAFFIDSGTTQNTTTILQAINISELTNTYWTQASINLLCLVFFAYLISRVIRFSGGDLILPLIISLFTYKLGFVELQIPEIINIVAMIVFGTILGNKIASKLSTKYIPQAKASVIFTVFCLFIAFIASLIISNFIDVDYFLIFLALAPGSIPEISLIAIALGLDVGLVAVAHIFRYVFVMLIGIIGINIFNRGTNDELEALAENIDAGKN